MVKKENRAPERCYKLLKMYTILRPQSHIDNVKDMDLQSNKKIDIVGEGGILVDLPLEYQVYRIIALSGEKGITANSIRNSLSFVGTRVLVRALEKLVRPSKAPKDTIGINRIAEFVGKERHYRYFAAGAFENFLRNHKIINKNKIVSLTELRRRQYLIERLEKENIIEINSIFLNDLDEYEQNFGDNNHKIDKKTILRMVKVLEKEEALKILIIQLPTLYGDYINKTLILNQNVPTDCEEVKQFIDSMRDKNVLNTGKLKQQKVKFADSIEMENLEDLKKRMKFHQKSDSNNTVINDKDSKGHHISPIIKDNVHKKEDQAHKGSGNNENNENNNSESANSNKLKSENTTILWNCIAQNYGWITAKMIRVKLLHVHILKCILKSQNINELDKNKKYYPFEATLIIKEMTMDLYLKIIGQLSVSTELDEYLRLPDSKKKTILEFPKNIKYIFFGGKMRFRRILKSTLEILIALKLIKPINEKGEEVEVSNQHYVPQDTLCHKYHFYISVPLYDYAVRELTFIKRFNIYNFEELNNYWIQLQCICQQRDPDIFTKDVISSRKKNKENTSVNKTTTYITNIRNWQISISCTASQKLILDTYINKQKGITPLNNNTLCKEIAAKIGISEIRVKSYYTRYELKYRKKKLSLINYRNGSSHKGRYRHRSRIKKSLKIGGNNNYNGGNNNATSNNKETCELMRGRPSFRDNSVDHNNFRTGLKRKNIYSNKYTQPYSENDLNSLPVIGDIEKYKSQYEANNKRKRPNWTAAEDEVLIHAYVISKHRADKAKLLWSPISLLFPNRTRELCRRRINVLLKNIYIQEKIRQLYIQWKITSAITIDSTTAASTVTTTPTATPMKTPTVSNIDAMDIDTPIQTSNLQVNTNNNENNQINDATTPTTPATNVTNDDDDYIDLQLNKDLSEIDLKPLVEYFMKHVDIKEPTKITDKYIPLPDNIEQVNALFNVKSTVSSYNDSETCLEDILEELSSLRAKLYALYCRPLTVNAYKQEIVDNYINEDNLMMIDDEESEKIKALLKMILMTPKEQYSSTQAFSVLNSFSQEEIILAIQKAKNESMLVKVKGFTDRRVPGRGFHLSDKFLSSLSKRLPENLIYQASIYEHDLRVALNESESSNSNPNSTTTTTTSTSSFTSINNTNNNSVVPKGYVVFPPLIDGGGMASLIDLLSSGKIELKPVFKDQSKNYHDIDIWIRKAEHSNELNTYKRRFNDEDSLTISPITNRFYDNQLQQLKEKDNYNRSTSSSSSSPSKIKVIKNTSGSSTNIIASSSRVDNISSFNDGSPNEPISLKERYKNINVQELIKKKFNHLKMFNTYTVWKIFQCIEEEKEKGISLKKLKAKMGHWLEDTTEFDLYTLLKLMTKCLVDKENNISLIISAGFKIRRYIAFKYISSWILPQHYVESDEEDNNYVSLNEFGNTKLKKRNPIYSPFKMWYNLDGEVVKSILRDCLETVLSAIVQNPGIYESRLFQKFSISMSKCELQDLLEMLLEKNIIRNKIIVKPKKPSIFDFDNNNFDYIDYGFILNQLSWNIELIQF
ncbi:hypothetical protein U3516DRAFT_826655 [Neocallimastix sp. 'constans']